MMTAIALAFAAQGLAYNVPPLRTKDVPYLDVLSESVNNPLRLAIGWAMIDPGSLPPVSIIIAYWFGGAFLMGTKRLSEYREIVVSNGAALLARYRKRSEEHTSELQSLMRITYAVFCLKKKNKH